jgi:hypothetical protein
MSFRLCQITTYWQWQHEIEISTYAKSRFNKFLQVGLRIYRYRLYSNKDVIQSGKLMKITPKKYETKEFSFLIISHLTAGSSSGLRSRLRNVHKYVPGSNPGSE